MTKEYAEMHSKHHVTVAQKCQRGGFKTAQITGRDWLIDEDEPYTDNCVISGKYRDWRKMDK